jgi:hypothetical protein
MYYAIRLPKRCAAAKGTVCRQATKSELIWSSGPDLVRSLPNQKGSDRGIYTLHDAWPISVLNRQHQILVEMDLGWRKRAIRALKATFCGDFH